MRAEVFDYIKLGEEIVVQPLQRLIEAKKLVAYRYGGVWACMDTFKEKMMLDDMANRDKAARALPTRQRQVARLR